MSDSDSEFDENTATIDDADIASVETAIDALLNKTQNLLQYPYEPSDGTSTGTPSAALDYRLSADIVVTLDTTWPLFAGLTLTNITLRTRLDKSKNDPGIFRKNLTRYLFVDIVHSRSVHQYLRFGRYWQHQFPSEWNHSPAQLW